MYSTRKPFSVRAVFSSRRTLLFALSLALVGIPGGLRAEQDPPAVQPPAAPLPATAPVVTTIAPGRTKLSIAPMPQVSVYIAEDETLKTKVELEANDMPVVDALKKVLDQAKVKYEIDSDVPTDKKVTMTLKNVPLSVVLSLLTREAGVSWYYSRNVKTDKSDKGDKKDEEAVIKISKKGPGNIFALTPGGAVRVERGAAIADAMRQAELANRYAFTYYPALTARLPDKMVKIDARNQNLRDILKDVLKQADLDYALEDDVPEDTKRSFTFENIPISMALDVICRSAEIGWRAERQGTGKETKTVIRIGKKYARRSLTGYSQDTPYTPMPTLTTVPFNEQRVSFTCPHCKSKVRVVRDSRDEKQKAWKFCPVCGKPVDVQSYLSPTPATFKSDLFDEELFDHQDILLDLKMQEMKDVERPLFGLLEVEEPSVSLPADVILDETADPLGFETPAEPENSLPTL